MQTRRNRSNAAIALVLMLTIAAPLIAIIPIAVVQAKIATTASISVNPKLVGLGQYVLVNAWTSPQPPYYPGTTTPRPRTGYTFIFTKPDATTLTFGNITSDGPGTCWFNYAPDKTGVWSIVFSWDGDELYEGSVTEPVEFTVQSEPVPGWPAAELPEDYWERPISSENREWYKISGPWLQPTSEGAAEFRFNPYSEAPNTAHILWNREESVGGIIGGDQGSLSYSARGPSRPIIMAGRVFYGARGGFISVDLRTGEEIYWAEGSITVGQDGTTPYLWGIGGTYNRYNAYTGALTTSYTDAKRGIWVDLTGNDPAVYCYVVPRKFLPGYLLKWDPNKPGATWSDKIVWNSTIPALTGDGIYVDGDILVLLQTGWTQAAYNTTTGEMLWSVPSTEGNYTQTLTPAAIGYGKAFFPTAMDRVWHARDLRTGDEVWVSEPADYPWGAFWDYNPSCAYGNLYAGSYDGHYYCFDAETGNIEWRFYSGNTTETPYGTFPFFGDPVIADGKVYAAAGEHSPTQPYLRGFGLYCMDAFDGTGIWSIAGSMSPSAVAEGYLLAFNSYDGYLYCFGKGKTATTVSASPTVVAKGSSVVIQGTVLDQSPAQPGTPCVSKESMTAWMEYLHMQKPQPDSVTGVPVDLYALSSDGSAINIGEATSDMSGHFSYMWTPPDEGPYTIAAYFAGDDSYWSSWAGTGLGVDPAPPEPTEPAVQEDIDQAIDSLTPLFYGIIVAVAVAIVIGIVTLWALRKRQ